MTEPTDINQSVTQRASSRFIGYSEREIAQAWNSVTIRREDPDSHDGHHLTNVIAVSEYDALYDADGHIVPISAQSVVIPPTPPTSSYLGLMAKLEAGQPQKIQPPENPVIVDQPMVLIGHLIDHWGHFLLEGMSRLRPLVAGSLDPDRDTFFVNGCNIVGPTMNPGGFFTELFSLAGIGRHNTLVKTGPTLFRSIKVFAPSVNYSQQMFRAHARAHEFVATRCQPASRPFDKPVFISRSRYKSEIRTVSGEEAIERVLAQKGFETIYPEELSIPDQIALFSQCPLIVGSEGSAFHSILFEPPGGDRRRVMLSSPRINTRCLLVDEIKPGHVSVYIKAMSQVRARGEVATLDAEMALAGLREAGVI